MTTIAMLLKWSDKILYLDYVRIYDRCLHHDDDAIKEMKQNDKRD